MAKIPDKIRYADIVFPGDPDVGIPSCYFIVDSDEDGWLIDRNIYGSEEDFIETIEAFRAKLKEAFELIGDTCYVRFDYENTDD